MRSFIGRLVAVLCICALATPAAAELLARKDLSLATALAIATTAAATYGTGPTGVSDGRRPQR
jgi:hypothetical protein